MCGLSPTAKAPPEAYSPEMGQRTYQALYDAAAQALKAGTAVIADAVFARPEERAAIEAVAAACGVPVLGLWLEARPEVAAQRIETRRNNASDATVAVLAQQQTYSLGEICWQRLDSSGSREDTDAVALAAVSAFLNTGPESQ